MELFKDYLDQIKATEELKERTKQYLNETLTQTQDGKIIRKESATMKNKNNIKSFTVKKVLIPASAAAAVLLFTIGGYAYYKTPVNFVSLDINPSVEIGLNTFDKVVSVEAANEDGEALIEQTDVSNLSAQEAIEALVQEAEEQGYVSEDGSTVVAVTAESNNEEKAQELEEQSKEGVNLAAAAKKTFITVYSDCSDLSLRTEAKELGISPGKYKMIKMLINLDPTITVEQYKEAKVRDIFAKAEELIKANGKAENSDNANNADTDTSRFIENVGEVEQETKMNKEKASQKNQNKEKNTNKNGYVNNGEITNNQNKNGETTTLREKAQYGKTTEKATSSANSKKNETPAVTAGQSMGNDSKSSNAYQGKGNGR